MTSVSPLKTQSTTGPFRESPPAGVPLWWIVLALVALVIGVYGRGLGYGMLEVGDYFQAVQNPVAAGKLNVEGVRGAFSSLYGGVWTPLSALSFSASNSLFGMSPQALHVQNVILHAITVVCLFLTLKSATRRLWPSAVAAALFAVHPVNVESVAWIAERRTVLGGMLSVLTVGAYLLFTRTEQKRWYAAALVSQALALLSNPSAVMLPVILLIVDLWPATRKNLSFGQALLEKVPFAILSLPICLISLMAPYEQSRWVTAAALTNVARVNNAVISPLSYLADLYYPLKLSALYPQPVYIRPVLAISCASGILLVTLVAFGLRRSRPYLFVGWLWFLVAIAPSLGALRVGTEGRADRYLYFAGIGMLIATVWLVCDVVRRRNVEIGLAVICIVAFAGLGARDVGNWRSSIALLEAAVANSGPNAAARELAGWEQVKLGEFDKAAEHFEVAVRVQPELTDIWYEFGQMLKQSGRMKNAVQAYWIAVRQEPKNFEYRRCLADALIEIGERKAGVEQYQEIVRQRPSSAEDQYELGKLLVQLEQHSAAVEHLEQAARLQPGETSTWHPFADLQAARAVMNNASKRSAATLE